MLLIRARRASASHETFAGDDAQQSRRVRGVCRGRWHRASRAWRGTSWGQLERHSAARFPGYCSLPSVHDEVKIHRLLGRREFPFRGTSGENCTLQPHRDACDACPPNHGRSNAANQPLRAECQTGPLAAFPEPQISLRLLNGRFPKRGELPHGADLSLFEPTTALRSAERPPRVDLKDGDDEKSDSRNSGWAYFGSDDVC